MKWYLVMIQPDTLPELKNRTAYVSGGVFQARDEVDALRQFNEKNGYRLSEKNVSIIES